MNIKEFKLHEGTPVQDLIAFIWLKQKQFNDLEVPFQFFEHRNLQRGKACVGKIISVGPKVESFKAEDLFYFNEYEADTGQFLKENEVYFIEEKIIEIKFLNLPKEWVYRS